MKKLYIAILLVVVTVAVTVPIYSYTIAISRSAVGAIVQHKWKASAFPLTWRMNPTQGANVTGARSQNDVFTASFAAWQALTTASVSFTQGANTAATARPGNAAPNLVTTNPLPARLTSRALRFTHFITF